MVVRREVTVVLPRTIPAALAVAALVCAPMTPALAADPAANPAVTTPTDPATATDPNAEQPDDMAAGLAPLLEAVDEARALRLDADKKYAEASQKTEAAEAAVSSQKGEVADARELVAAYARAAYRSGPSELAFLAGLLDSGSPTDLMRRVDDAERVGTSKDTEYDRAQQVLLKAQRTAARTAAARDRASDAVQEAASGEAAALAEVTDYTGKWADQLAADAGGATDQDRANSIAAQAWSDWLARPEADGAPTVTVAMVRSGKDLPDGVFVKAAAPGVAFWSDSLAKARTAKAKKRARSKAVLLLPDQTVQMITYGVSRLGSAYQWRANADDAVDCAALVDRAWALPGVTGPAATAERPSLSVAELAGDMRTVPVDRIQPGDVVFYSDPGHGVNHAGLAVSVLLPAPRANPGWVPLATGLALRQAVLDATGYAADLKWPNDLLDPGSGRKLAGILCELIPAGVVIGAGLNIDHAEAELPVPTATSLALVRTPQEAGVASREELAGRFLREVALRHTALMAGGDAAARLRADYRAACATLHSRVVVEEGGRRWEGEAVAVDDLGRLVVDGPAGRATVSAGDVHHVRPLT